MGKTPNRCEIWLCDWGTAIGHEAQNIRAGVIVSNDMFNKGPARLLVAVPLTTTNRHQLMHVECGVADSGLKYTSYARCDQIRALSRDRVIRKLGKLHGMPMIEIHQRLRYLLDM